MRYKGNRAAFVQEVLHLLLTSWPLPVGFYTNSSNKLSWARCTHHYSVVACSKQQTPFAGMLLADHLFSGMRLQLMIMANGSGRPRPFC